MYFQNQQQWDQGSRGPITPQVMQMPAAHSGGGSLFDTLLGLVGSGMSFASGDILGGLQGLSGAVGGKPQVAQGQSQQAGVSQGTPNQNPAWVGEEEKGDKEKRLDPQPIKQTDIEVTPPPTPTTVFDPTGIGVGQQNLVLQLLLSGLLGGPGQAPQQPQVPYSSQTNFQRGY